MLLINMMCGVGDANTIYDNGKFMADDPLQQTYIKSRVLLLDKHSMLNSRRLFRCWWAWWNISSHFINCICISRLHWLRCAGDMNMPNMMCLEMKRFKSCSSLSIKVNRQNDRVFFKAQVQRKFWHRRVSIRMQEPASVLVW